MSRPTTPSTPALLTPLPADAERLLTALASQSAPPHLEARLLARLAAQRPADARYATLRALFATPYLMATAAVVAAGVLAVVLTHAPSAHRHMAADVSPLPGHIRPAASLPLHSTGEQAMTAAQPAFPRRTSSLPSTSQAASTPHPLDSATSAPSLLELAAAEAAAPSQAPPPLPVTATERDIRRFSQQANAVEQAALNAPAFLAARDRAERERLAHFFAPPPEPTGNGPLVATSLDQPNSFVPAPGMLAESQ